MQERITIKKESLLKDFLLLGLQAKGYEFIKETDTHNPIKVFYYEAIGSLAIYDSGPYKDDELVIVNLNKPMKVKVLIKEYRSKKFLTGEKNRFDDVIDILENLTSPHKNQRRTSTAPKALQIIK
jgi:hypothetical protein